jgi:hypothetical protein
VRLACLVLAWLAAVPARAEAPAALVSTAAASTAAASTTAATTATASPASAPSPDAEAPSLLPAALSDARLELDYALSARQGALKNTALTLRFGGLAPSHLRLSGAAFLRGSPFGAALDVSHEWFAVAGADLLGDTRREALSAPRGALGVAARLRPLPALSLEGQLGYALGTLPFVDANTGFLRALPVTHHGPQAVVRARLAPGGAFAAQLSAALEPFALADSALGTGSLARLGVTAQVEAGGWKLGGARWAAVLGYTLEGARGTTGGTDLAFGAHRLGLGLRVGLGEDAAAPRRGPRTLRGRVTLGDGTRPAEGVGVALSGGPRAETDARGEFSLALAEGAGPAVLTASAPGFRDARLPVDPSAGEPGPLELVLEPLSGPGRVTGTVRLAASPGAPAGASPAVGVRVEGAGGAAVQTGADGRFVLEAAGPGPVQLSFTLAGHRTASEVVSVPPGGEATLDVVLERAGKRALASLRGQVRSAAGRPLAAAQLRVPEAKVSTRAAADGAFQVRLAPGRYTVVFSARGYVTQSRTVDVAEGDQTIFHVNLSPVER